DVARPEAQRQADLFDSARRSSFPARRLPVGTQLSWFSRRAPVTVVRGRRPAREWPVRVSPSTTTSKSRLRRIGRVTDCRQVTRGPSQTIAASGTVSDSDVVEAVPASTPPVPLKT